MNIVSDSVNKTRAFGALIARHARPGDIALLFGQLGSGKTVLTKGMAQGLGIKKDLIVSPTFVLLNQYIHTKVPLYHFDLYRLDVSQDILGLGYEEYLYGQGVSVVEWADRLGPLMPKESLKIELAVRDATSRSLKLAAQGKRSKEWLAAIQKDMA